MKWNSTTKAIVGGVGGLVGILLIRYVLKMKICNEPSNSLVDENAMIDCDDNFTKLKKMLFSNRDNDYDYFPHKGGHNIRKKQKYRQTCKRTCQSLKNNKLIL
jgi:hypothetical protein